MNGFWPTLLKTACKPLGTAGGKTSCAASCTGALSSPSTSTAGRPGIASTVTEAIL